MFAVGQPNSVEPRPNPATTLALSRSSGQGSTWYGGIFVTSTSSPGSSAFAFSAQQFVTKGKVVQIENSRTKRMNRETFFQSRIIAFQFLNLIQQIAN
jgi:hypothetical protein